MARTPLSLRMDSRSRSRLAEHAGRRGESQHTLALRLLEESLRMLDHPGIVFRDGPAGRRAALVGGPDVWEVVGGLRGVASDDGLDEAARDVGLSRMQVDTALRYYADHRDEIDERIRRNREEAERRESLLRAGRDALA